MSNPQKAKGDRAERAVRDYLRDNGFPATERTRAGYTRDAGDLHPCRGVTVQVKDRAAYAWPEWLRQLDAQKAEAGADHALLVLKRRGLGDPGDWLAVMPLSAMTALLKAAGYGIVTDSAEVWPEHDTDRTTVNCAAPHDTMDGTGDLHRTQSEPARDLDPTPPDPKDSPVPFVNPRTGERAQLATIAEAADALRCTQRHIYHLLAREDLTRFKIAGLTRIDLNEVAGLITVDTPGSDVA